MKMNAQAGYAILISVPLILAGCLDLEDPFEITLGDIEVTEHQSLVHILSVSRRDDLVDFVASGYNLSSNCRTPNSECPGRWYIEYLSKHYSYDGEAVFIDVDEDERVSPGDYIRMETSPGFEYKLNIVHKPSQTGSNITWST